MPVPPPIPSNCIIKLISCCRSCSIILLFPPPPPPPPPSLPSLFSVPPALFTPAVDPLRGRHSGRAAHPPPGRQHQGERGVGEREAQGEGCSLRPEPFHGVPLSVALYRRPSQQSSPTFAPYLPPPIQQPTSPSPHHTFIPKFHSQRHLTPTPLTLGLSLTHPHLPLGLSLTHPHLPLGRSLTRTRPPCRPCAGTWSSSWSTRGGSWLDWGTRHRTTRRSDSRW